jgi:hypothetical protein
MARGFHGTPASYSTSTIRTRSSGAGTARDRRSRRTGSRGPTTAASRSAQAAIGPTDAELVVVEPVAFLKPLVLPTLTPDTRRIESDGRPSARLGLDNKTVSILRHLPHARMP